MNKLLEKNRNRNDPTFANINLLGKCNTDCYFCLGKDIPELLGKHNQTKVHFSGWKNFLTFLAECQTVGIKNLYITGQNTDACLYKYLGELIDFLQLYGFSVGIRTNGYNLHRKIAEANKCRRRVGLSIHTLETITNNETMGRKDIPKWHMLIPQLNECRVSIVVTHYNKSEFETLIEWLSKYPNIKYIQARRVSTDTREQELLPDIEAYEKLYKHISKKYKQTGTFYLAEQFLISGKEVNFWRTTQTEVNSYNYFTDGTISKSYFVVEGYKNNYVKPAPQRTYA